MRLDQKAFLVLNAVLIGCVLLIFLRSRKKDGPSRLNLGSQTKLKEGSPLQNNFSDGQRERSINVIFQYNGHSWDAFEVLGVPAGSSKGEAERMFDRLVKIADQDQLKFYKAAIDAIRES